MKIRIVRPDAKEWDFGFFPQTPGAGYNKADTKEIDIDEAERDWRVKCFDTPDGQAVKLFSKYLQEVLDGK